jgi:SAM-dependent methyltransferase
MNNPQIKELIRIIKILDDVNIRSKRVAIFPYGTYGVAIKGLLEKYYQISPAYIIDNGLADCNDGIEKIEILKEIDTSDVCVLFCCVNPQHQRELYEILCDNIEENKIVSLFTCKNKSKNGILLNLQKEITSRILYRHHRIHFLQTLPKQKKLKLLDVGCGNQSAELIKGIRPNIYYTGIDVGDYNQSSTSLDLIDNYVVVKPEDFAKSIEQFRESQDVVISNHNIEHTNEPEKCLESMAESLKHGGRIYIAFPSKLSTLFPSRAGTLNFYDDESHKNLMDFEATCKILRNNGIKITFATPSMRGWYLKRLGEKEEGLSASSNRVLGATWDFWGFEAIIWGVKK